MLGEKVRPARTHYRPARKGAPLCGSLGRRPSVTGDEWQVTCRGCLKAIAAHKRTGRVDLFGGAT